MSSLLSSWLQPPAAPRRVSSVRPGEHLPRPAKPQDLGIYREPVQLRRQPPVRVAPVVLYDVPRSNRRVVGPYVTERSRTPPAYENVADFINDDKRLRCTTFTTF
jgi:hypothetical protein